MSDSTLDLANLTRADQSGVHLNYVNLKNGHFARVDFSGAELRYANLLNSKFH